MVAVAFQYSFDGAPFASCTPAVGTNPVSLQGGELGAEQRFNWAADLDLGTREEVSRAIIRAVVRQQDNDSLVNQDQTPAFRLGNRPARVENLRIQDSSKVLDSGRTDSGTFDLSDSFADTVSGSQYEFSDDGGEFNPFDPSTHVGGLKPGDLMTKQTKGAGPLMAKVDLTWNTRRQISEPISILLVRTLKRGMCRNLERRSLQDLSYEVDLQARLGLQLPPNYEVIPTENRVIL